MFAKYLELLTSLSSKEKPNGDNDHYIKHMALFFKLANYLIMLLFLQKEYALPPYPAQYRLPSPPPQSFLVDIFLLRVTYMPQHNPD